LNNIRNHITVFEHETLRFDKGEKRISKDQFIALQKYYGEGVPFFSLCYNGVRFNEYVGAIQVGNTLIEVLPKADQQETDEKKWRDVLIGILNAVHRFKISSTSSSSLKIKPNTILDLYFELFVNEVAYLLHNGLSKQYRKKEGNISVLKGSLHFGVHIQKNLIHQERFFVRHTTYDYEHKLHFILYKTLRLLKQVNTNPGLQSRIASLLLFFPEMPDIKISQDTFENLNFNRKTLTYKRAVEIARLLLLQYHPDIIKGKNDVLALMFDMNLLWEQFVLLSIQKHNTSGIRIFGQTRKGFWRPKSGNKVRIKPDIWIECGEKNFILDTKWKNLNGNKPSASDLQQLFVYHEYYNAEKVALVYPGTKSEKTSGHYLNPISELQTPKECSIICLSVEKDVKKWQRTLNQDIHNWLGLI
jgi:5-methylcytosine-specific restriction enzyme subunit McrC